MHPEFEAQTFKEYFFKRSGKNCNTLEELKSIYIKETSETPGATENFFNKNIPTLDLNHPETIQIKNLQCNDLYYLYINILFEIIYIIPKVNENNIYYYELVLIVNKNTNLNKILNYKFNLIELQSILPINTNNITYEFVKSLFILSGSEFNDNVHSKEYDFAKIQEDFEEQKMMRDENLNLTHTEFQKLIYLSSNKFDKIFDQNLFAKATFKNICLQIYSFDRFYRKHSDEYGFRYIDKSVYGLNFEFATNYFQNMGMVSVSLDKNNKPVYNPYDICISTMSLNFSALNLLQYTFSKEFVLNGFIDFDKVE